MLDGDIKFNTASASVPLSVPVMYIIQAQDCHDLLTPILLITYVHEAVYRVPDVLPGGDQDTGHDQHHHTGLVVKPEHIVVNADCVKL